MKKLISKQKLLGSQEVNQIVSKIELAGGMSQIRTESVLLCEDNGAMSGDPLNCPTLETC